MLRFSIQSLAVFSVNILGLELRQRSYCSKPDLFRRADAHKFVPKLDGEKPVGKFSLIG